MHRCLMNILADIETCLYSVCLSKTLNVFMKITMFKQNRLRVLGFTVVTFYCKVFIITAYVYGQHCPMF